MIIIAEALRREVKSLPGGNQESGNKLQLMKTKTNAWTILKAILAVNLALLFLLFQSCGKRTTDSQAPGPGGVTVNSMPIIVQYDQPSSTLSQDDLLEIATRYKAVSDNETCFSGGQRAKLRGIDPEIKLFRYLNSAAVYKDRNIEEVLSQRPDWVLRDEFGEPLSSRLHETGIMMDPASTGWRGYLVDKACQACAQKGYDGILLDEVLMVNELDPDFEGINKRTGQPYTTQEYRDDQYQTVRAMKDTIGAEKLLMLNNVKRGSGYFEEQPHRFLEASDGVVAEGFRGPAAWPLNRCLPEDEWVQNVEMMRDLETREKFIVVVTKVAKEVAGNQAQLREHDLFMYTTFLLGMGEFSYYTSGVKDEADSLGENRLYYDYWQIDVGQPLSSYEKSGSHYHREFQNARVLVNPTDSPTTVDLGTQLTTPDGKTISEVTLDPHTGTILLK